MKRFFIFGEDHTDPKNIEMIRASIAQIKPDFILHELFYEDKCLSMQEIKSRLSACVEGGVCDPTLNKDVYELGLSIQAKLVGIDKPFNRSLSLLKQFELREDHMVSVIDEYMDKGVIVVVVGDTHLRDFASEELGRPSPLFTKYRDKAKIIHPKDLQKMSPTSHRW